MDTQALRYKRELALSGMKDGPPSCYSASIRLEQLLAYQKTWPLLSSSHSDELKIPRPTIIGISGGFLYHASENSRNHIFQWSLELYELRSFRIGRTDPHLQFRRFHVPFEIETVIIDRSQGLLVLVELHQPNAYVLFMQPCVTPSNSTSNGKL